jgi:hypothetical protein
VVTGCENNVLPASLHSGFHLLNLPGVSSASSISRCRAPRDHRPMPQPRRRRGCGVARMEPVSICRRQQNDPVGYPPRYYPPVSPGRYIGLPWNDKKCTGLDRLNNFFVKKLHQHGMADPGTYRRTSTCAPLFAIRSAIVRISWATCSST